MKKIKVIAVCMAAAVFASCSSGGEEAESEMVKIPGKNFRMMKTEVTQNLYESVMGENPSGLTGENNPVENVSWYDSIYFCNKLSVASGYTPVYSVDGETDVTKWNYTPHGENKIPGKIRQNEAADGYRLPSVAEWEFAAKGGESFRYAGSNAIDEVAWYEENSGGETHPVAQKKMNGYGLFDMSGNVWEWCWGENGNGTCFNCGGGKGGADYYCEVDYRTYDSAGTRYTDLGFRVVRSVK